MGGIFFHLINRDKPAILRFCLLLSGKIPGREGGEARGPGARALVGPPAPADRYAGQELSAEHRGDLGGRVEATEFHHRLLNGTADCCSSLNGPSECKHRSCNRRSAVSFIPFMVI